MLEFNADQVRMHQKADDKTQAIALVAAALAADGLTTDAYLAGMRAREQQSSTHLGHGVAIPHGTPESRSAVLNTGVRLLHFPEGVDWGGGDTVYLVVGIAAQSDEHIGILQQLTRALNDDDLAARLAQAPDAQAVLQCLSGEAPATLVSARLVQLGVAATDFESLVWAATQSLKDAHVVRAGFFQSLMSQPALMLGDGLWWLDTDQAVVRSAVAFVTPASAISHDGMMVRGVLCLARAKRAQAAFVDRISQVLADGQASALLDSRDADRAAQLLGAPLDPGWPTQSVRLPNPLGLHARPANALIQVSKSFDGAINVRLATSDQVVSAKSLSRLLSLGAHRGDTLVFSAEPSIAARALPAMVAAVASGLGEAFEPLGPEEDVTLTAAPDLAPAIAQPLEAADRPSAPAPGIVHQGVPASPGVATGPAFVSVPPVFTYARHSAAPEVEIGRLDDAIAASHRALKAWLTTCPNAALRDIFSTHLEMLEDPEFSEASQQAIRRGASAEAAWAEVTEQAAAAQAALPDALLAERAADIRDVGRRVLATLCGVPEVSAPDRPYVLIMSEVGPSDVARLDPDRVAGILTARGGATSHSAIVARSLGIAAIVGAGEGVLEIAAGTPVLIDGGAGRFDIDPDAARIERAAHEAAQRRVQQAQDDARAHEPAITQDGHRVEVCVNLGDTKGVGAALKAGAEGVGLLRTEFLFMAHAQAPGFQAQVASYTEIFDALNGLPLVVRTLDVGGDKPLPYWSVPQEENPFLGMRGIRLCLQRPEILRTQLHALLEASRGRPLRIMFPMVADLFEWRAAQQIVKDLRAQHDFPALDLQLGIMIEVPSAVLIAEHFAREVDFFSIGTNDLTQYVMAIDRGHPALSDQADGLHPAVLKMIAATVQAAHAHGKWVGVCGELAADAAAAPILLGLGVDEFSLSRSGIARLKASIRSQSMAHARALAAQALQMACAQDVRDLAKGAM